MKKVIAISSSGRMGNTYKLIKSCETLLSESGIELEIIHLHRRMIKSCVGCERCILTDKCGIKDDVPNIMDKLVQADGIILTSPVYMGSVSGQLKTLIDRTCKWYHRPMLVGKPVLLMTTTAGGYAKDVLAYMEKVSVFWGMNHTGSISRMVTSWEIGVSDKEIKRFIESIEQGAKSKYQPTYQQVTTYQLQKVLAMKILPNDRSFWEEKEWAKKIYYSEQHMPLHKKLVGMSYYKLLDTVIKPANQEDNVK
ncbi:MAG: flavodoxin family protein [Turicibacter sp.]